MCQCYKLTGTVLLWWTYNTYCELYILYVDDLARDMVCCTCMHRVSENNRLLYHHYFTALPHLCIRIQMYVGVQLCALLCAMLRSCMICDWSKASPTPPLPSPPLPPPTRSLLPSLSFYHQSRINYCSILTLLYGYLYAMLMCQCLNTSGCVDT